MRDMKPWRDKHTLDDFIFWRRIKIDKRWDKSAMVVYEVS